MKILFFFYNNFTPFAYSPAIQILSAVLKEHGHQTMMLHIHDEYGFPDDVPLILKKVKDFGPDFIGFTATSYEIRWCNEMAGVLRKHFEIPLILGGIYATINPEDYNKSNFDIFVVGEGEEAIMDIINRRIEKGIIEGQTIQDLNTLPFFDWDVLDTKKYIQIRGGWINILFSRGCPFNCTFCVQPLLRKFKGTRVRKRAPEKAITELLYLVNLYPIKVINIDDDELSFDKEWLKRFLALYKEHIYLPKKIPFLFESRVDTIDEKIVQKMKESGCMELQFGIETGNEKLRNSLKKNITNDQIISAFDICKKYGINTYAYMILGFPDETPDTIADTFEFLAYIRPRLIRPTYLCPIPGSELYRECKQRGLLKDDIINLRSWNSIPPLAYRYIKRDEIELSGRLFPWFINTRMGLKDYARAIEDYKAGYISGQKQVLHVDKELDMRNKGKPHYAFMDNELVNIGRCVLRT